MSRLLHRQRVVHLIRTAGPLARADLADRLGLSRSSITTIIGELLEDGTLIELDSRVEAAGYRGRPRVLLGCNPQARRVLGVWIDERRARVVVADASGNVSNEGQTPTGHRSPASVIRSVIQIARKLSGESDGGPVAAAGVCIPGIIDGRTGTVVESNALGWSNVELGKPISRALGVPTAVQDTTQAVTLAESISGQAREARSAVVLDYGERIGVGLIIEGRPYSGASGAAGAIGHVPVFGSHVLCQCGRIGCLDACMSLHAMKAVVPPPEVPPRDIDIAAMPQHAEQNPDSQHIVREVIDRVAHTAILVEALIDPELLIIAGSVVEFEERIESLEKRINEIRPPERRGRTTTVRSQIGRMNTPSDTTEAGYRVAIVVALQLLDADIAGLLHAP